MRIRTVFLRCEKCKAINRLAADKLNSNPKCGKCKSFLHVERSPIEVTGTDFDREVLSWPGIVLTEFWTPRCGHCMAIAPIIEEVARERAGFLKGVKINVENEHSLAMRFNIRATPAFLLFRGGGKLSEIAGSLPKAQLEAWIDSSLL